MATIGARRVAARKTGQKAVTQDCAACHEGGGGKEKVRQHSHSFVLSAITAATLKLIECETRVQFVWPGV